jgi:succinyl-CoA synthetase alpha subunit
MKQLLNKKTRVIVQGITGKAARYHTNLMLEYGTNIIAGVSPHKEGSQIEGIPVYNSVRKAAEKNKIDASIIFVPAKYAADAIIEAANSNIPLIVCITEHIPVHDMIRVKAHLLNSKSQLIGPNCPGLIAPGQSKLGIMPGSIHLKGNVGLVSRSGTLTYEAVNELTKANIGQSLAVGIGGDPIVGTSFIDMLDYFNQDKETEVVVLIGEIGGNEEEKAANWIAEKMKKPVIGFISGKAAPHGKTMGHAGAIISQGEGSAVDKIKAFKKAGVVVADTPKDIADITKRILLN